METEDAVDEIDGTVHSAGSGTVFRHSADSSIESCNMSNENINGSLHSVYDNSKIRNNDNNNDDNNDNSFSNNRDNSHNSNNNDDDDDNGIAESGAVCVDEQPHIIIKDNKLDAENNSSAKHCENSEVDDVVENRKIRNTVLVEDNISETCNNKNDDAVVYVDKTHNNNKVSRSASKQDKYQENLSQKFQFKEFEIAKKLLLSESILKKEYEIPMSPLLCSLSISPPHTPTRIREYLVPDAAKKGTLKSEISIQDLNVKLDISPTVVNTVRVNENYETIDVENFHREFEAKYRRNVEKSDDSICDDDVFNIRMNDDDNNHSNSNNSKDSDNNDSDRNDNNNSNNNNINNNNHNTNNSSPLCVGPLKIPSQSLLAATVAVDEVVWAELSRLGDGSKVLEIYSMSDQKLQKKCSKNVNTDSNSNSNSNSDSNSSICCGEDSCVCGHDDKEENDNDNRSNNGNCSMVLVASYTIIPDKYRIISKQKTLHAINKSHENDNENENETKNGNGNSSGSNNNLTHSSNEKEKKDEKKEKKEKTFFTVDSLLTVHGFEIYSPHKMDNVNISLQKSSSFNIITNSNFSNIKIKEKVENVLEEHSDKKKVIHTSLTTVKIIENEIVSNICNDNDNDNDVNDDGFAEWKTFWCESESDCAEWMLSLRCD